MINSDFVQKQAAFFAASLGDLQDRDLADIVRKSLQRVVQREPKPLEIEQGVALLESWIKDDKLSREEAVKNYCLMSLNLNEFVYLD